MHRTPRRHALLAVALTTGLLFAACGDDDEDDVAAADADAVETTTTAEPAEPAEDASETEGPTEDASETEEPADGATGGAAGTLEVQAVDYAFEGLPDTVPAGTKLTLTNTSDVELHELVAMRLPDEETRPLEELLALPQEELMKIVSGPPATVLLAAPGGEQIAAVGDGTLSEPGRYAIICSVPTGADPEAFLAEAGPDGPPEVEGGPPHLVHGMHAELVVE